MRARASTSGPQQKSTQVVIVSRGAPTGGAGRGNRRSQLWVAVSRPPVGARVWGQWRMAVGACTCGGRGREGGESKDSIRIGCSPKEG